MEEYLESARNWAAEHPWLAGGGIALGLGTIYFGKTYLFGPKYPPGPRRWPFVGSMFSLSDEWHYDFMEMRQKYGDVFTIYFGSQPMVVLASTAAIKEAFITRGNDFANRPYNQDLLGPDMIQDEILNTPFSDEWAKNKKLAMQGLRTYGGVKSGAAEKIVDEMNELIGFIQRQNGKAFDVSEVFLLSAVNVMSNVLFNERYPHDDARLLDLRDAVQEFYTALNTYFYRGLLFPTWYIKLFSGADRRALLNGLSRLRGHVEAQAKAHVTTRDPDNPRDYLDMMLAVKPLGRKLYDSIEIFLPDSTDTVGVFMRWIVMYLGIHQDVQKKLREHIHKIVGTSRRVTIADRAQMAYADAVLLEIMRISDGSVVTGTHAPIKDTTFRGYDMPRSVWMMACLYTSHKDPAIFPEPDKFDPHRFLDENGSLVNTNQVIPFGVGRRMCMGETLAKMELFLFVTNIFQVFSVRFPGDPPTTKPLAGVIPHPVPYEVIFTEN